jgi:1,4-alpha-glucan branching enzyme
MYAQPGKKLLFMGNELGQEHEWDHDTSLDWNRLFSPFSQGLAKWLKQLNRLHVEEKAFHELDFNPATFEWVDCNDTLQSIISFLRKSSDGQTILSVFNFTPVPHMSYRIGVPHGGFWTEIANSDALDYSGSGQSNAGGRQADPIPCHGRPFSLSLTLPPLGAIFLKVIP